MCQPAKCNFVKHINLLYKCARLQYDMPFVKFPPSGQALLLQNPQQVLHLPVLTPLEIFYMSCTTPLPRVSHLDSASPVHAHSILISFQEEGQPYLLSGGQTLKRRLCTDKQPAQEIITRSRGAEVSVWTFLKI